MTGLAAAGVIAATSAGADTCQLTKVAGLPVTVAPGDRILVEGSIKGQPTLFQVDTGTTDTMFDVSVFARFGIVNTGGELTGLGATGETTVIKGQIPDLKIGNFKILSLYQIISERHFLPDEISGLFGEDFFISFDVDFDLKDNLINLFQYNACAGEPIYWSKTFSEADILVQRNAIYVTVELNGKPARALLDTGAGTSIVSLGLARRLGIGADSPGMIPLGLARGIGAQALPSYGYRFAEIRIGDELIKNPFLRVFNLSPIKYDTSSMYRIQDSNQKDYDMLLGADFIKAHHIYISTRRGKMYFTYNGEGAIFPVLSPHPANASPGK